MMEGKEELTLQSFHSLMNWLKKFDYYPNFLKWRDLCLSPSSSGVKRPLQWPVQKVSCDWGAMIALRDRVVGEREGRAFSTGRPLEDPSRRGNTLVQGHYMPSILFDIPVQALAFFLKNYSRSRLVPFCPTQTICVRMHGSNYARWLYSVCTVE